VTSVYFVNDARFYRKRAAFRVAQRLISAGEAVFVEHDLIDKHGYFIPRRWWESSGGRLRRVM
jgi:hypothetical protein